MSPTLYKWSRRLVIGSMLFGAVAGPLSLLISARSSDGPPAPPPTFPTQVEGFAETAVVEWLSGGCTTLPVAAGVDPCFGRSNSELGTSIQYSGLSLYSTSTERFVLGDEVVTSYLSTFQVLAGNELLRVTAPVTLNRVENTSGLFPVLAAAPSALPATLAPTGQAPGIEYSDAAVTSPASKVLREKVGMWADAYAADDADALRLVVGGGPSGIYPGLGGLSVEDVTLGTVVQRADGSSFMRVGVVFAGTSANEWWGRNEFDLLIAATDTPDPRVVAWGPVGSGPKLKEYENIIAG